VNASSVITLPPGRGAGTRRTRARRA
jgi:hypothetical protein